jgi:hypothetical protein
MHNLKLINYILWYLSRKTEFSRSMLKQWNIITGICVIRSFNLVLTSISHY